MAAQLSAFTFSRGPLWSRFRWGDTKGREANMAGEAAYGESIQEHMVDFVRGFDVGVTDLDPAARDAVLTPESEGCVGRCFGVGHAVFYHGQT
jgi:hypothetical protein